MRVPTSQRVSGKCQTRAPGTHVFVIRIPSRASSFRSLIHDSHNLSPFSSTMPSISTEKVRQTTAMTALVSALAYRQHTDQITQLALDKLDTISYCPGTPSRSSVEQHVFVSSEKGLQRFSSLLTFVEPLTTAVLASPRAPGYLVQILITDGDSVYPESY